VQHDEVGLGRKAKLLAALEVDGGQAAKRLARRRARARDDEINAASLGLMGRARLQLDEARLGPPFGEDTEKLLVDELLPVSWTPR
jgi:hypothetical protein